ncbi:unnamed protein product [Calypogeia fissa]
METREWIQPLRNGLTERKVEAEHEPKRGSRMKRMQAINVNEKNNLKVTESKCSTAGQQNELREKPPSESRGEKKRQNPEYPKGAAEKWPSEIVQDFNERAAE